MQTDFAGVEIGEPGIWVVSPRLHMREPHKQWNAEVVANSAFPLFGKVFTTVARTLPADFDASIDAVQEDATVVVESVAAGGREREVELIGERVPRSRSTSGCSRHAATRYHRGDRHR